MEFDFLVLSGDSRPLLTFALKFQKLIAAKRGSFVVYGRNAQNGAILLQNDHW